VLSIQPKILKLLDKWYRNFLGKVKKNPEFVEIICEKQNHSTENSGNSSMKIKWKGHF